MTTVGPDCPADELLANLFTGKLDIAAANGVLTHLAECDRCADRMDRLAEKDESLAQSAVGINATASLEPEFQLAADRVRKLRATEQRSVEPGRKWSSSKEVLSTDRYAVSNLHASGGVGEIWLATDRTIGRDVAFKTLRESSGDYPDTIARFLTEARVTGQLEHPGIAPVYDVGMKQGKPFYTMRFVGGRTMAEAATEFARHCTEGCENPMDLRALVNAVIGVANAIAYAHSRGVIHRDLKGKNIVLGDFGEVIDLDWWLARVLDMPEPDRSGDATMPISSGDSTAETEDGRVVGTPSFMAPEQARGARDLMNEQTDVYGLGAVLYQCLTGEAPFGSGDSLEILRRASDESPPAARSHWPDVPRALEAICNKAMAREQVDRYASAGEFAQDLQRWLADEPVTAYPEPVTQQVARFARKNRSWVTGGMALALTAIVSLAASTLLISREQEKTLAAQKRAEQNFEWANNTVQSLITRVNDPGLREIPYLDKFRERALNDAISFNEQFLGPSGVPSVRLQAGMANHRIASLYAEMDMPNEAIDAASEAVAALKSLQEDEPRLPRLSTSLAKACYGLASRLHRQKQLAESQAACDEAIAASGTGLPESSTELGRIRLACLCLKSRVLIDLGRQAESEQCAQIALGGIKSLTEQTREEFLIRAEVYSTLANLLKNTERVPEAARHFESAITELESVIGTAPDDQEALTKLSVNLASYANLLHSSGRRADSEDYWNRSIKVYERMAEEYPYVPQYQQNLTDSYLGLAVFMAESGSMEGAGRMFRSGLESSIRLRDTFHSNPQRRYQVASARRLVAIHLMNMSKHSEALPVMRQAAGEFTALAEDFPSAQDYRFRAASALFNLATAEGRVQEPNSLKTMGRAVGMLEQLCETSPDVVDYAHRLGAAYRVSADLHLGAKAEEEALQCFEKSIEVHRRIAKLAPDKPKHERQLGIALYKLGEHHLDSGRIVDAEKCLTESVAIREKLLRDQPDWFYARMDLVLAHDIMGKILRKKELPEQAEQHFRSGADVAWVAIEQELHGAGPKREYAAIKQSIAQLRVDAGKFGEALEILKEPIGIFREIRVQRPDKYEYVYMLRECLADRARALIGLGRRNDALECVEEMLGVEPLDDWEDHQTAAELYVLCSNLLATDDSLTDAERQVQVQALYLQAAKQIRIAISKGYADFADDKVFDAVRDHAAFRELGLPNKKAEPN